IPFGGFLLVLFSAVFYVQDIYHLPQFRRAFHYVFSSLFGLFYPIAEIEGGRFNRDDPDDESQMEERHLLRAIGGPGLVKIQPGNAVAFRDWQNTRGIGDSQLYFLRPFEMIARVVNLEDQHGHMGNSAATTRDGIRLRLRNIDYRVSILPPEQEKPSIAEGKKSNGKRYLQRNQSTPFPYSQAAINSIAYSFSVSDRGLDTWHEVVKRNVGSALSGFISEHDLDYLTAPRQDGQNPRRELRVELFAPALQDALRKAGAELHWMDIGQFDIDDLSENKEQDPVDQARTKFWAARWVSDAHAIRSYGEARHLLNQELARAEAQAEMIMSIADALRDVSFGKDRAEAIRHIFLVRTAQILEALRDGDKKGPRS
ncbi:MAG TPA: hypothetical protein VK909_10560, partial [Anaerolineales bacterium]|nr:hypothetical protein [Anaerolineales bacterium]